MTPNRQETVNGHKVEQYYWAGRLVVYVDNRKTDETFDEAVERLLSNDD